MGLCRAVHPHIRGAYIWPANSSAAFFGSSPHTWGIPASETGTHSPQRFIPTYVGHTRSRSGAVFCSTVHPHIRGAYSSCSSTLQINRGSSPHTWGIPIISIVSSRSWRFIPTYVGHTLSSTNPNAVPPVHPHIRGAYPEGKSHSLRDLGSSPHTWGIHWTAVRKMAGFSHFSYDFIRKSYFVQGLVFFGVIGAEASPTHRRGRNQCLPGAHGGSVRNL